MRKIIILLFCALSLWAQSATRRNPNYGANKLAGGKTLPASCTDSQLYYVTGVGAYQCVSGAWRKMADLDADGNLSISTTVLGPKTIGAGANQLPAAAAMHALRTSSESPDSIITRCFPGS